VLLPEMWATGFDYPRTAQLGQRTPEALEAMERMAARHQVYVAGSLTELDTNGGRPYNTLFVAGAAGVWWANCRSSTSLPSGRRIVFTRAARPRRCYAPPTAPWPG
jgi:Predicted amidohydrolase